MAPARIVRAFSRRADRSESKRGWSSMFHELVSHNDDIRRLLEKGYAVALDSLNYLVVRDIPYLDQDRKLRWGAIVSKVVDAGQNRLVQDDHQVFFAGGHP